MEKRGTLDLGRRIEQAAALIARAIYEMGGVKDVDIYDLMPHEDKPTATTQDILKMFGG